MSKWSKTKYLDDDLIKIVICTNRKSNALKVCDLQVAGSSSSWSSLRSGLGQATYTCVSFAKQYKLVPVKGVDLFSWESNRGPGGK